MTKHRKGLKLQLAEDPSSAHDAVFKRRFFHHSSPYFTLLTPIVYDKTPKGFKASTCRRSFFCPWCRLQKTLFSSFVTLLSTRPLHQLGQGTRLVPRIVRLKKKRIKILQSHCWRIGRRIDVSVAGCFLQGQVASLSPNLAAAGIEPRASIFPRKNIYPLCYNRILWDLARGNFWKKCEELCKCSSQIHWSSGCSLSGRHHTVLWQLYRPNQNWTLYTALVQIVNASESTISRIDIRHLKKGRSHMSTDTVHANIESKIRHTKVACSFQSLNELIFQAHGKNEILNMCFGDSDCGCQEETRKKCHVT